MTAEEIKDLPTEEKFLMMEALWTDFCEHVEHAEIPEPHKEIITSRRERVESGESKLLEWDAVKSSIGRPSDHPPPTGDQFRSAWLTALLL